MDVPRFEFKQTCPHAQWEQKQKLQYWNVELQEGPDKQRKSPNRKNVNVKDFLVTNDLQLLYLIEADLHGATSRVRTVKPITSKEIEENLKIENYK